MTHAIEIERKYDVDDVDAPLPDLARLPGVVSVGEAEDRALDAVYFDTDALALAAAAVALRRRTGGPDAGWHVKTTAPEGRHEYGWPLGDERVGIEPTEIVIPADPLAAVVTWTSDAPLTPLARVENARRAIALRDAEGGIIAEFTDDRVRASDLRAGAITAWREWELELGPAGPASAADREAFFAAADDAVASAGGRPAASGSKLQRALGR